MHSIYPLYVLASFVAVAVADTCLTSTSSISNITSVNTATCTPQSIAACPTSYDPCCAFICAEAQVPFDVCSPSNRTELAVCSQCPTLNATATSDSTLIGTITPMTTPTPNPTITTPPSLTSFATSTCTGRLLSSAGCPTPYDPCCAYVCEEAQVPFDVCSQTDGSGEFAVCSQCPAPTPES